MSSPPSATCRYCAVVLDDARHFSDEWRLSDESGVGPVTGDSLLDHRLVGLHPTLEISDAGLTPDTRVSPHTGTVRPKVMLSRLTLRADGKNRATVATFSFCVDQALTSCLRTGDVVHIAVTSCGGLGLSIVRAGRLLAAVGAVTAVPHGELVEVRIPLEVIRDAERVFQALDPEFEFTELPIEVHVHSERRILWAGRPRIGDYEVFVEHGFYRGLPGTDECVAVSLVSEIPATVAVGSAQLLEYTDLWESVQW